MKRILKVGQVVKVKMAGKTYRGEIIKINVADLSVIVVIDRIFIKKFAMSKVI